MSAILDEDLPGYCEIHCRTDRAMFAPNTINRLIALAGYPEGYVRKVSTWLSLGPDVIDPLAELARDRMKGGAPCR